MLLPYSTNSPMAASCPLVWAWFVSETTLMSAPFNKVMVVSPAMMRLVGLFVPSARASVEMMYEFTDPFVVDSSKFEKAFAMKPTSLNEAIRKTVEWYKSKSNKK
ncbi:MAG: hypothetical protein Q7J07_10875 [Pelolinea sp.]|nr:hypothetical protein [Pelolinea sp.]